MNNSKRLAALLLAALVTTQLIAVPTIVGYLAVSSATLAIIAHAVQSNTLNVCIDRVIAIVFAVFAIAFGVGLLVTPTITEVVRTIAYLLGTAVLIFVIPAILPRDAIRDAITRTTALFILVGLPTFLVGTIHIAGITIPAKPRIFPAIPGVWYPNVMKSLFTTPRMISYLATLGVITAAVEFRDTYSKPVLFYFVVNLFGVYATQSRASWIALLGALAVYLCVRIGTREIAEYAAVAGIFAVAIVVPIVILADTPLTAVVNFTDRGVIWQTVIDLGVQQPILGYGAVDLAELLAPHLSDYHAGKGTHNSYLRAFLMAGVIGFVLYLALSLYAAYHAVMATDTQSWVFPACLLSILIMQGFASFSLFGIGLRSGLFAVCLGYVLQHSRNRQLVSVTIPKLQRPIWRAPL